MEIKLFGFDIASFRRDTRIDEPVNKLGQMDHDQDGSAVYPEAASNYIDTSNFVNSSENSLIESYRRISYIPEVSTAIDEVVNECIVVEDRHEVVELNLENVFEKELLSDKLGEEVTEAFAEIIDLLDLNREGYDIFRTWYIDSRISYLKIIDPKRPRLGIRKLQQLDPRRLRRIKIIDDGDDLLRTKDEFYAYVRDPASTSSSARNTMIVSNSHYNESVSKSVVFKVHPSAIAHCSSGLVDKNTNTPYGFLHKAVRVANQLDLVENSLIVYRISRSHNTRAIYVSTGNLPPAKAQAKVEQVKRKFKREVRYDTVRGELTSTNRTMDLTEDFYLGRDGANKTTEIQNLSESPNLGSLEDVEMFKEKLYWALDIPVSRFKDSSSIFSQSSNITRDEIKFQRFVTRLRTRFSGLLMDLLRTQVILKRIMTAAEFDEIAPLIRFKFNRDNFFAELKELEILGLRIEAVNNAETVTGKYISHYRVRRDILGQSADEIEEEDKRIEEEQKDPRFKRAEDTL